MRIKQRITVTLSKEELRIIEKYGFRNKSVWIGEMIREWYVNNVDEVERMRNILKWKQLEKIKLEDEMSVIAQVKEKLEAGRVSQAKAIIHSPYKKKR